MSKIVCDVCGGSYPETENQCPICGTAKTDASVSAGDTAAQGENGYAYVKGGRFSKSNVKKHNSGKRELPRTVAPVKPEKEEKPSKPSREEPKKERPAKRSQEEPKKEKPAKRSQEEPKKEQPSARRERRKEKEESSNNIGLIIIVIILVLAIIAVCAFVIVKYIDQLNPGNTEPTTSGITQTDGTGNTQTDPTNIPVSIPCNGLRLPITEYTFTNVGDSLLLNPIPQPANTTESFLFLSGDERIATVDRNGKVTAVADGETTISVFCGSYKAELKIICTVGVTPPDPTDPPGGPGVTEPTEPTEPYVELKLNRTDFTLNGYGASHNLYSGSIDRTQIVWTSSNEDIATVTDGKVVAVGNGTATITAEYAGQVATCIVRCQNVQRAEFTLSRTEFSIKVGESYTLQAYDAEGLRIDPSELTFTTEAEGFFTVDENGKITGVKSNYNYLAKYTYVYVEYNGEKLRCIVHVNE